MSIGKCGKKWQVVVNNSYTFSQSRELKVNANESKGLVFERSTYWYLQQDIATEQDYHVLFCLSCLNDNIVLIADMQIIWSSLLASSGSVLAIKASFECFFALPMDISLTLGSTVQSVVFLTFLMGFHEFLSDQVFALKNVCEEYSHRRM